MLSILCSGSAERLAQPPASAQSSRSVGRKIILFSQAVGAEAHVAELAALRALADVLGELLRIQRLDRAVLALDAGDDERLAVGEGGGSERGLFRECEELNPDAAIWTLGHFVERKEEQARIGGKRRDELAF